MQVKSRRDQKCKVILGYTANVRPGWHSNKQNTRKLRKADGDADRVHSGEAETPSGLTYYDYFLSYGKKKQGDLFCFSNDLDF